VRVLLCLALLVGVVSASQLLASRSEASRSVAWLRTTIDRLQQEPGYAAAAKQSPKREELLAKLTQVAADFGLFLPLNHSANVGGAPICWRDIQILSATRPDLCMNDSFPSADTGRCYPACRPNFKGHQQICRENCKAGFEYHALFDQCVEIAVVGPNTTGCPWYDHCGHLAAKGCSKCPAGHPNLDLIFCECHLNHSQIKYKPVEYDRGHGLPAQCKAPRFMHNGMCLFNCSKDYKPIGSICIENCPTHYQEIGIICCATLADCIEKVGRIAQDALIIVEDAIAAGGGSISAIIDIIKTAIQTAMEFIVPDCINM